MVYLIYLCDECVGRIHPLVSDLSSPRFPTDFYVVQDQLSLNNAGEDRVMEVEGEDLGDVCRFWGGKMSFVVFSHLPGVE
jgi:hypothetical protein